MVMTAPATNFICSLCAQLTPPTGGYFNLPGGLLCIACGDREQVPVRNLRTRGNWENGREPSRTPLNWA